MTKTKAGWHKLNSLLWGDTPHSGIIIGRDWFGKWGQKEKFFVQRFRPNFRRCIEGGINTFDEAVVVAEGFMKAHP